MEKVWLSATYYLDPAVLGLTDGAEVLFTRMIAYCGAAETFGIITETALKTLGVRALFRKKSELLTAGLVTEIAPGKYKLKGWDRWQQSGDDMLKRRKNDAERKRKQREREANASRDMSRDVTPENRVEEKREELTYVSSPSPVARRERPRGGREVAYRLNGTAHSAQAHSMANAYANSCQQRPPGGVISKVAQAIDGCLQSGYDQQQIETGIAAWTASDMSAPSQIENFVHKSVNRNVNAGNATSKAEDWLTLGQQLHDEQRAINQ